ncbi:T9SS type B sorting domain-containing protein [Pedobacter hiemivivus]|uniref:T9SS type B sorting domain-containing protein n=1 Tax=Pedobacter hiemivivus TaxID=2530454 RepID=A0A4U1GF07_9SPHI|nr:gliding motility-associated C-terminal domain-containing protein [Pedobacter hiemivivus]TKC61373.1 T9SS type B sorting domain-containing protein [Pedobacter hiemivivus]
MNTKFIRICIFIGLFLQTTAMMAQRNVFRAANATITASLPLSSGAIANLNDGSTTTTAFFNRPASSTLELTIVCAKPERVEDYTINFTTATFSARDITFFGSQNGTTWTLLDTKTGPLVTINSVFTNANSYTYYKYVFTNFNTTTIRISEISGFGTEILAPILTTTPGATGNLGMLSWTQEIRGTGEYEIQRSSPGSSLALIKTVAQSVLSLQEDTLKRNTTYFYKVRVKKGSVFGPYSEIKELITTDDKLVNKPILTGMASLTTSTTANLNWSLPMGGPGTFTLERSLNGTDFTLLKTLDKAVNTFADTTLTHNTSYWYRVIGKNDISSSPYSDAIKITTINDALLTAPVMQATAPTGTQAVLSWNLAFNTKGGFEVEKSTDGTNFTLMGKFDKAVITYIEESLKPNTPYWYRVRAFNYIGKSPYSTPVKITTNGIKGLPADITDDGGALTVTADNSGGANAAEGSSKFIDNNISTKWLVFNAQVGQSLSAVYAPKGAYIVTGYTLSTANDSPARDPKDWRFEGSDDNAAWTVLDTRTNQLGAAAERITTYSYSIANPGTKAFKFYRIAFTSNNNSTDIVRYQIAEWQILGLDPGSPDIPTNLAVTATTTNTISLSWAQDKTIPVKGFILQRSVDGLFFEAIDTLESTVTSFIDRNLYDGANYYYRLNAIGDRPTAVSAWSNVAMGKTTATDGLPLTPAYLMAIAVGEKEIKLQWTDRSTDETGFLLERSQDNVLFEELKTLAPNTNTFADASVWPATNYYYRISAIKEKTKSVYSNVLKVLTMGANSAPLRPNAEALSICTGTGEFKLAINAISPGPGNESTQKLKVTGIKAGDERSVKFFSSYSFNPVVAPSTIFGKDEIPTIGGIANFSVTTTGIAVPGDSALVMLTVKDNGGTNGFASDSTEFLVKIKFTTLALKVISDQKNDTVARYAVVNFTGITNFPDQTRFQWADAEGIIGSRNGIKLSVIPKRKTTYTLTATTPMGCTATASITILPKDSVLLVSNVLTPNQDGKNDTWMVWGIEKIPNNEVKVMDRQGRLVFTTRNYRNDWDGTHNGVVLPQGGYYYVIETNDGRKAQTGVLTIIK